MKYVMIAFAALSLAGCATGKVAADGARAEACGQVQAQIEAACQPDGEGACEGTLTMEETVAALRCTRAVCDMTHKAIVNEGLSKEEVREAVDRCIGGEL